MAPDDLHAMLMLLRAVVEAALPIVGDAWKRLAKKGRRAMVASSAVNAADAVARDVVGFGNRIVIATQCHFQSSLVHDVVFC